MGKIFYLMGKSSTGKDTIFKKLLQDKRIQVSTIVPYTTRPIRIGETNGVEYIFINEEQLLQLERKAKIIEMRSYNTFHGVWKYFTVADNQINLNHNNYLMIGTIESYRKTKQYFGQEQLVPILIDLDDGERLTRALTREKKQKKPRYEELCRRFLTDSEDFSEEKILAVGITKRFYNNDLEQCLNNIVEYIISFSS